VIPICQRGGGTIVNGTKAWREGKWAGGGEKITIEKLWLGPKLVGGGGGVQISRVGQKQEVRNYTVKKQGGNSCAVHMQVKRE